MNSASIWYLAGGAGAAALIVVVGALVWRHRYGINQDSFQEKWRDLQKLCGSKETWQQAVVEADTLLDTALRKRRMRGKTQGERLTKAQRLLTDNEDVWFGHKLRLKIEAEPGIKLKEKDVKQALVGIRQALKDLGALVNGNGNGDGNGNGNGNER